MTCWADWWISSARPPHKKQTSTCSNSCLFCFRNYSSQRSNYLQRLQATAQAYSTV